LAPDMLVLALILVAVGIIFWIKRNPKTRIGFLFLGLVLGLSYLVKTYMFPMSFLLISLAALSVSRWTSALKGVTIAMVALLLVSLPYIALLSSDLGRFTYGGAGNYNYAVFVKGKGEPVNPPELLSERPETVLFVVNPNSSFTPGWDLAKHHEGITPQFHLSAQLIVLKNNLIAMVQDSPWFFGLVALWNIVQFRWASPRLGKIVPPSEVVTLLVLGTAGSILFCLVVLEMRYVAPFLLLGFTGLTCLWRYKPSAVSACKTINRLGYLVSISLLFLVAASVIDQYHRAVHGERGKPSYESLLMENQSIGHFINQNGYGNGDRVALIESSLGSVYWARLANVKIVAQILSSKDYLYASNQERAFLINRLRDRSIKVLVGIGSEFDALSREGWTKIANTREHYILFTDDR
ncbi:MAG: hypothetical protein QG577_2139, partial [Thermodesulfobacteriota bacterium]|nr:hypothetical protein [Thermodesulfobacteriota bacterium]